MIGNARRAGKCKISGLCSCTGEVLIRPAGILRKGCTKQLGLCLSRIWISGEEEMVQHVYLMCFYVLVYFISSFKRFPSGDFLLTVHLSQV